MALCWWCWRRAPPTSLCQPVVRHAIPEANPSLYIGMSLGLTFPFNILVGIPLYVGVAQRVLG